MYSLTNVDHLMCAHSLQGEIFGPAQLMHVSNYDVEVTYLTEQLDPHGIVVDFGAAQQALLETLAPLKLKNLDEVEEVAGLNTTTENLAKYIHEQISRRMKGKFSGKLRITLHEGKVAWITYEAPLS